MSKPALVLLCLVGACQRPVSAVATEVVRDVRDDDWAGSFASTNGAFLEVSTFGPRGGPKRFSLTFSRFEVPYGSRYDCRLDGVVAPAFEGQCARGGVVPERCEHSLRVSRVDGGFFVTPSGEGWTNDCLARPSASLERSKLVRVDPFEEFVAPYAEDARKADLQRARNNTFGTSYMKLLGDDPEATLRRFGALLREELSRTSVSPASVTVGDVAELVAHIHQQLMERCNGLTDDVGPCGPTDVRGHATQAVQAFALQRETHQNAMDARAAGSPP